MATFPFSPSLPSTWTTFSSNRRNNLFFGGDTLNFTLSQSGATGYEVRDYYGTTVESGAVDGVSITLSSKPYGWYRLYINGPDDDENYGTLYGSTQFSIIRNDEHFPMNASPGTSGAWGYGAGGDNIIHGVAALGPQRYSIGDAADPETNPNGLTLTKAQAGRTLDASWYNNASYQDTARPRPAFIAFPYSTSTSSQQAGVTQVVETLYPNIEYFEGPSNEPTVNASLVSAMETFYNAVKAGHADAKVLGPCPVTVNNGASGLNEFLAAGGGDYMDGLSIHTYNCTNGDLALGRRVFTELKAVLDAHDFNKPIWQTENGFFTANYGAYRPKQGARWQMLQYLLIEQILGVPKERFYNFYDTSHGFWDYPSFWELADGTLTPFIAQMRTFSEEIYGKTFTSGYNFGDVGNNMYLGSLYTDAGSGEQVAVFMSGSVQEGSVTFNVSAESADGTLVAIDCFGNESSVEYTSNALTLSLSPEVQYIRLPNGVSLSPRPAITTDNLLASTVSGTTITARTSKPIGSGTATHVAQYGKRVADNVLDTAYYYNIGGVNGTYGAFQDDTSSIPAWVGVEFDSPQTVDHIVIFGAQPWQKQSTMTDFDIQTLGTDGTTWTTRKTFTQTPITKYAPNNHTGTGCTYDQWGPDYCVWEVSFDPAACLGVRVYARGITYGDCPTAEVVNALTSSPGLSSNKITIRDIQVFSEQTAQTRVAVADNS